MDEDVLKFYFEDRIHEGTKFILEKEDHIVHVWYNHYHSDSEEDAIEKGEYFHTYIAKKKPDIKIDTFTKKNGEELFQTSIILDAKF